VALGPSAGDSMTALCEAASGDGILAGHGSASGAGKTALPGPASSRGVLGNLPKCGSGGEMFMHTSY
jgi:hypothetical protein